MADRLDYSGYDFETALSQLETKLEIMDGWKDRVKSATGQIFLRLLAYVIDMDGFKIDRRAEESYRDFARLRSSVVALASNLGYTPRRKVSSVVSLKFTLDPLGTAPVVIPKGTVCASDGGIQFVTTEQGSIAIAGGNVVLDAKQGEPKVVSYLSNGSPSQSFVAPATGDDVEAVENTSLVVKVGGVEWAIVDSFIDQLDDAEACVVVRKKDNLLVQFGDDKNGKIPPSGDSVDIEWLETLGSGGDVLVEDSITAMVSVVPDVTVTNGVELAQGGEDEEDIEEIRVNMSQIFATGDRAVTNADYRAILLAYPGVAKANAYGEQEALPSPPNPEFAWRVELVVVPAGGGTITRTQENQILEFLETKKVNTTYITFKDPSYIPLDFSVHVILEDDADAATVTSAVEAALDAVINFVDIDLGEAFRVNDAVAAVEAVDGVRSSVLEVLATHEVGYGDGNPGQTFNSALLPDDGITPIPLVPVDRGNVLVYLEDSAGVQRRVGYDKGDGTFTSDPLVAEPKIDDDPTPGAGGSMNYTNGEYVLNFIGTIPVTTRVILKYQTGVQKSKVFGVGDAALTTFSGVLERNLSPTYVGIYEEGIQVGVDDGNNNIVDFGGSGRISGGSVNYVTGDVQVVFVSAPADGLEVSSTFHYEFGDISVGLDQMLLMGRKDVTTEIPS